MIHYYSHRSMFTGWAAVHFNQQKYVYWLGDASFFFFSSGLVGRLYRPSPKNPSTAALSVWFATFAAASCYRRTLILCPGQGLGGLCHGGNVPDRISLELETFAFS